MSLSTNFGSIRRGAIAVAAAIALTAGFAATPALADSGTVTASSAGSKEVGSVTYVWGNVSGFSGDVTVSTQVQINGAWSTSQVTSTNGSYTLPLTYGSGTAGTYTWRVVATDGSTTTTSSDFTLTRTARPTVTASSAGSKEVGATTYVWGNVSGFDGNTTVSTQVQINGKWSTSRQVKTQSAYTLPLTYGSGTAGTYTWRIVASNGTRTAISPNFTLKRTPKAHVTATSAGTKTVGHDTHVWGTLSGFNGQVRVSTQVQVNGSWTTSQSISTSGSTHTIPLTYGKHSVGTYTYRVVATDGDKTATSGNFTLRRTAAAPSSVSDSVWAALAKCESGGNPRAVSSSGRYHGLYQFSVATWRSVGGTGLPSNASAEEQTNRAKILQARSGWGQWPACSSRLGLR